MKKNLDQHTRLLENDDLPLNQAPAVKKKLIILYARANTRENMCIKDT